MKVFLKKNAIIATQNVLRDSSKPARSKKDAANWETGRGKKIETGLFSLTSSPSWKAGGTATKVYELMPVQKKSFSLFREGFEAYWLAYYADRTYRSILGNDAKYMFTANLSGCTFAHGCQTPTGHILVGHSNEVTAGRDADIAAKVANKSFDDAKQEGSRTQAERQKTSMDAKFEKKKATVSNYLHPSAYGEFSYALPKVDNLELPDALSSVPIKEIAQYGAFVVGVKEGSVWKFYCQRRVLIHTTVVVHDVIEI